MKLTIDQKIAFAEFLESEKRRHQEDIAMIDVKLLLLKEQGIVPTGIAPWVEDEDLLKFPINPVPYKKPVLDVINYNAVRDDFEGVPEDRPFPEGWVYNAYKNGMYYDESTDNST